MKRALVTVGAHDDLSGLLVRGEKGTGKSTLARALADAVPRRRVVADCPFGCPPGDRTRQCPDCRRRASVPVAERPAPFVTLPLGATREALVGSLSVADALDGDATFEPGLLARANRGVLYVDEVNLLDDHLVDVLLDAAASGVNRVERDGVSRTHPAEFTLIGTMNPEEGDLRPQLRDRFDLAVEVTGLDDPDDRAAVVRRAIGDADEQAATRRSTDADGDDPVFSDPAAAVGGIRDRLDSVRLPSPLVRDIVAVCDDADLDGHRGDIAAARCARALAAGAGRARVTDHDVRTALSWAIPHRLRSDPFDDPPDAADLIDDALDDDQQDGERAGESAEGDDTDGDGETSTDTDAGEGGDPDGGASDTDLPSGAESADDAETGRAPQPANADQDGDGGGDGDSDRSGTGNATGSTSADAGTEPHADGDDGRGDGEGDAGGDRTDSDDDASGATPLTLGGSRVDVGEAGAPDVEAPDASVGGERASGRSDAVAGDSGRGPRVRTERLDSADAEAVDAGASVRAAARRGSDRVESRDLRRSVRAGSAETLVCFVVDASASMRGPMRAAKGVAVELLRESYEHRDAVSLVAVAGEEPDVLLPPTDDVGRAARHLKELPAGDRTPLAAGLDSAAEVCTRAAPEVALAVVVTDGGANAAERPTAAVSAAADRLREAVDRTLVVDAGDEDGVVPTLLDRTGGDRVPLSRLSADRIDHAAGKARSE
nr:VWA domain-containing protein [Halobaculum gomorrense]